MDGAGKMRARHIRVRQVDPFAEREPILAVLRRNLPAAATPERLAWLYLSNPDGPALVWLAEDPDGMPLGTSAAHPRRMRIDGSLVRAVNLGDFAVDQAYRTLGPALQLLRATLAPVCAGAYAFSYDYPSRPMHALYKRMGRTALGRSERWVRPVALKTVGRRQVGEGVISAVVGAAADWALRTRDALAGAAKAVRVEMLAGACGEEFDALDARLAGGRPVRGVRDAAYLNWRYRRHTMWRHAIICARRDGRLAGYAVLRHRESKVVSLVDLQSEEDESVCRRLVAEAVHWARCRDAEALDVEVLGGSASARLVRSLGFIRRQEQVGPVAFFSRRSPHAAKLAAANNWWLMGGDRDI